MQYRNYSEDLNDNKFKKRYKEEKMLLTHLQDNSISNSSLSLNNEKKKLSIITFVNIFIMLAVSSIIFLLIYISNDTSSLNNVSNTFSRVNISKFNRILDKLCNITKIKCN